MSTKPRLQLALDQTRLDTALRTAETLSPHVDIIEAGTILCISAGIQAVSALRERCPQHTLVADLKVADAGATLAEQAFGQGADWMTVICAAPAYLARYGTPGRPEDLADHLCLSHTVWTARNEWRLPGVEGEVRWKRDAVLRCNDGYALRQAAIAGAGLLMQPEVLLADALASGSLVRVLEAWTPQPRPVHLLWRQDRRP
ncbi:MAG: orotidine 5'-phosphate decarboxylase / HUMPS family protein, partial [Serratia marcescens]|nr:orotidine 5'-phosphate decarboxylase / HUMPS family protein [Serratia marcescens]